MNRYEWGRLLTITRSERPAFFSLKNHCVKLAQENSGILMDRDTPNTEKTRLLQDIRRVALSNQRQQRLELTNTKPYTPASPGKN